MSTQLINSPAAILTHANGTSTGYFPTANTDAARGIIIQSALADAVSGETIAVYGNAAITSNLAKDGVNWWFAPGVTITRTSTGSNTLEYIFNCSTAMSFIVGGHGKFVFTIPNAIGVTGSNSGGVLRVANASCNISFSFDAITYNVGSNPSNSTTGGLTFTAVLQTAGKLEMLGNDFFLNTIDAGDLGNDISASTVTALWWQNGDLNVIANKIASTLTTAQTIVAIYSFVTAAPTGDSRIDINRIDAGTPDENVISATDTSTGNAATWIRAGTIQGSIFANSGKLYVTCQKLLGYVLANASSIGTKIYLTTDKIGANFAAANPAIKTSGAGTLSCWLNVKQFEPGTNWGELANVSIGTVFLDSQDMTANTGQDAVLVSGGRLNLMSGSITRATGKLALKQTGGALAVSAAVDYTVADTSGTITHLKSFGA